VSQQNVDLVQRLCMRPRRLGRGIETERNDAYVLTLAHANVVRLDYYNNRTLALRAAGLSG
jgi:hypothetical protein